MKRKGQAAMEFLMTYGWAILAAIIVIGVLAIYFRPSTLVTESAIVTAPLYAMGATISPTQIQLEIKNNGGESMITTAASVTVNTPAEGTCAAATGTGALAAGATQILNFNTCSFSAGDTVNADVEILFTRTGSELPLSSTGTITGKA
ncbi:MAG: hypothetical protein KJ718_04680 [Nanoarchaeota archaeon]|nr:hypothetical protein [Nanoarchaeota archaeon]MBU1051822.1 hypothetical protein [Nanoarchaeota archaeon]MBU1988056.1 hypothetical protein [Nanoarchaeota archaeon]